MKKAGKISKELSPAQIRTVCFPNTSALQLS